MALMIKRNITGKNVIMLDKKTGGLYSLPVFYYDTCEMVLLNGHLSSFSDDVVL